MKRLDPDAKLNAYNDAIECLRTVESASDTREDKKAREWLANKLDKECQDWYNSLRKTNGNR